eukprot:TRINITY_DN17391_c0_g1_i1.p1 TRINITY_DN17391_c0_g1~~TRINITY_DN17391_c0_g1_i1.p1  ORF type:complete len:946 (+),score=228.68 TRINITY_DN17391_c0_g1_i1:132-2969(+)
MVLAASLPKSMPGPGKAGDYGAGDHDAATKIQAQVRRKMSSDEAQYNIMMHALNEIESKAEKDLLEDNRVFSRAAAIMEMETEGQDSRGRTRTASLGSPGSFSNKERSRSRADSGHETKFSLFQLQRSSIQPSSVEEIDDLPPPPPKYEQAQFTKDGVPRVIFETSGSTVMITREILDNVLKYVKNPESGPLEFACVRQLVLHATEYFRREVRSALVEIPLPESPGQCVVLGDTHGQLNDFLWVLFKNGAPSQSNVYLLNGDIADRGNNAIKIFVITLMYKLFDPDCIHVNRGNHEDPSMNETFGFLTECCEAYGAEQGRELWDLFNVFFEHLPLFTLIDENVFVVHGGLARYHYGLHQLRRANFRRPIPEPGPPASGPADAVVFDSLWADPQAGNGYGVSQRGPNIITWGADITRKFMQANKIRLLVRSHEVPNNGHGGEWFHGGSGLTLFSASNYCGRCGNLGAVLVLSRKEEDRVEEHWAPSLDELSLLEMDADNALSRIKAQAIQKARLRASSEAMETEVLRRVQELIVKHKTELFEYWSLLDCSPRGVFSITAAEWRDGCSTILGEHLPWYHLQESMHVVRQDGTVHYVKFLTRYRVAFTLSYGIAAAGWERAVWSKIMETLLRADLPLREALAAFDATNNGIVSPTEFGRLLESCGVMISKMQARALLRTFAASPAAAGGQQAAAKASTAAHWEVSLWDVLARLQVTLPVAPAVVAKDPELARWAVPKLRPVAAAVLDDAWRRLADSDAKPEEWPAARLLAVWFEDADKSGNGYLQFDEFVEALAVLGPALQVGGCPSDKASLSRIARYCDVLGNGRVNYFDFLNGLTWEDSLNSDFESDMLESINAAIYFNIGALRRALQRFDPTLQKRVRKTEFVVALKAVHAALLPDREGNNCLTPLQIEAIAEHIQLEDDETVNYEKFLGSFRIVDTYTVDNTDV